MNSTITLSHFIEALKFKVLEKYASAFYGVTCLLIGALIVTPNAVKAQVPLVGWDVSAVVDYGTSPFAPNVLNSNIENVMGLSRGAGVNAGSGGEPGGWGGTNWQTTAAGAITNQSVINFSFKPKDGFAVSLLGLDPFSYRRTLTGPQEGKLEYTINGGTTFSGISQGPFYFGSTAPGGAAVSPVRTLMGDLDLQQTKKEIGFRLIPYNATDTDGSFYIYNAVSGADFSINGRVLGTTETTLALDACLDFAGTAQSFDLKGDGLTATNITITAPTSFEVSSDGNTYAASLSLAPSGGSVSQTYYVRLKNGLIAGSYNGKVTVTGGGFTSGAGLGVDLSGTVHALPTALVSSIDPICVGDVMPTISIALTGNAPFDLTYTNGTTSSGPTSVSTSPFEVQSVADGEVFTATALTDAKGCVALAGQLTGSATVVVNALPEVSVVASNGSTSGLAGVYNGGEDISLTATINVGAGDYSWAGPDGFTAGNNSMQTITGASSSKAGIYTVTVTNGNECKGTATVNVVVYDNNLYVDDAGDDNNTGDETHPLATIQKAVDVSVSGGIIHVGAGVYNLASTIEIDKSLTIYGPQKDVDPRTAAALRTAGSVEEAVLDGGGTLSRIIYVTAAGVVINGLEVTNGTGDLVSSADGAPVKTGMEVKYCIVHGSSTDEGVQLRNVDGGEISYNKIYDAAGDGINLCCGSTNTDIDNNELYGCGSSDAVIYLYDDGPAINITNNKLYNNTAANGIMVGNKNGSEFNKNSAFGNNAVISGNIVTGHVGSGVGIYINTSRVNVQDNIVSDWESTDAAVYLRFNIKEVSLTGNTISDNYRAIKVSSGVSLANAATLSINQNSIFDNDFGLLSSSPGIVDARENWWGDISGPSGEGLGIGNSVSEKVIFCPFLDGLAGTGVIKDCPVKNEDTGESFTKLQAAIDDADTDNGDVITVLAGTYTENVTVNKELDIRGPNYGISPNGVGRVAEVVVVPASTSADGAIFSIKASNVKIDGFTLNGDNTTLTSSWIGTNSADIDAGIAINVDVSNINNLNVSNNIIENVGYFGVFMFGSAASDANTSKTGNEISNNLIRDLGYYNTGSGYDNWGGGMYIGNSHYTNIKSNVLTNVRIGIQTGNFQTAHVGASQYQVIEDNTIETRYLGIFFNLHRYSPWTISNNTITGIDNPTQAGLTTRPWRGILLASLGNNMGTSIVSNNIIDGSAITSFTSGKEGINVWNVKNDGFATITGGSITGVETGIFLNNFDGYASVASDGAYATISGVDITATGTGIRLLDNPSSTHAAVQATLGAGIVVNGGTNGLTIENASAKVVSPIGDISFNSQSGDYIKVVANTNDFDATAASFEGKTGATANLAENFTIEDKITHKVDNASLGLVRVKSNELFVTTNSGNIQRAVNAASASDIVNVNDGTYSENIILDKKLTLSGMGDNTIIQGAGTGNAVKYLASGSGLAANDRAALMKLKLKGFVTGVYADELVDFVTIDAVNFDANTSYGINFNNTTGVLNDWMIDNSTFDGNTVGIKVASKGSVNGLKVTNSIFNNNSSEAIHASQDKTSPGSLSNVEVSNSVFTLNGHTNNKSAIYAEKLDHALIKGNTFTNNGLSTNARGMIINLKYDDYSDITVSENIINETRGGTLTGGYAVSIAARDDASYASTPASLGTAVISNNEIDGFYIGVGIDNNVDWNTSSVTNNKILNSGAAISATGAQASLSLDIHQNDLSGSTYALYNGVTGSAFDASCNWFGTAVSGDIQSKVFGDVTFDPYLTVGGDGVGTGFQPTGTCDGSPIVIASAISSPELCETKGSVLVTFSGGQAPYEFSWTGGTATAVAAGPSYDITNLDTGTYTITISDALGSSTSATTSVMYLPVTNATSSNSYATIQEAIDAASAADEIVVCEGTYNESLTIPLSINLVGPHAGISGCDTRGSEATIEGYIKVTSSDVTINGFKLLDGALAPAGELAAVHIVGGLSNVSVMNNYIERTGTLDFDVSRGVVNEIAGTTNLTVSNNYFTGWHTGTYLQNADADITDNCFVLNQVGISSDGPVDVQVSGNNITNNAFEGVGIGGTVGQMVISNNNITGNLDGVHNYSSTEVNAGYNWWGDAAGPSDFGPGSGDKASANVNFCPFLSDEVGVGVAINCRVLNISNGESFVSIQAAIDDAETSAGDTLVAESGTYAENVVVNKELVILGANVDKDCAGTRSDESIVSVASGLPFHITADNVVINGFEITAPASSNAVVIGKVSNASVMFNNIHDIGTSFTGGNIHAVIYTVASTNNSGINISDNCINDISSTSLTGYSSSAIGILQSTSTGVLTGLNIERNIINNVTVNDGNWPTGKIAYGIQINVGGNGSYLTNTGKVVNAVINQNEISNISGHIATAIGLEGNTQDGSVTGNKVSNLTSTKTSDRAGGGYDLNGLKFENNAFVSSVTVENNSFDTGSFTNGSTSDLGYAVVNYVPSSTAALGCNWYGTAVFNDIEDNNLLTGKMLSKASAAITFSPYLTDGGDGAGIGFQPTGTCDGSTITIASAIASPELCATKGTIEVTFSGGVTPYTLSWGGASIITTVNSTATITGLDAGSYTVTISDNNGSSVTTTAQVISLPVSNLNSIQGYATIQAAIDDATAGDVIEVCAGTYNERVLIDKSLTLQGVAGDSSLQIIDGTGLSGNGDGIQIANGVKNVNISNLSIQNFSGASGNSDAGIYAIGGNDGLNISKVAIKDNVGGSGIYANGPIDGVTITNSLITGHTAGARGIVIWNGFKQNITITGNTVNNSNCCGIELQDGTASAVNISNNTIDIGIGDNAMGLTSLNELTGPNVIDNNTITGGGRYGIEIKNPASGVTVSNNTLTLTTQSGNSKDRAGIAVFRRGYLAGQGYANIPNGVTISGNSITGYQQTNGGSNSDGFGIVVEGTNHIISNNTLTNNDIGIQQQAGHTPYTENAAGDGNDADVADLYFGRGNSPELCNVTLTDNVHSGNTVDERIVIGGGTGTIVTEITPTVDAITDIAACKGESLAEVVFTGNNLLGVVYNWTNNNTDIGLAASGAGNLPVFTATNTGITGLTAEITVTPTVNGCSGTPQTFTISISPEPVVDIISSQDVCLGGTVSGITFTGTGTSFDWINTNTSIGLAASGSGNIADFTAVNTSGIPQTGYITVTPSFTFGGKTCSGAPKTFLITVQDEEMAEVDCPDNVIMNNEVGMCSAVVSFDLPMAFDNVFFDGFESAASGTWLPYNSSITQVATGTDGITSSEGASHGEINTSGDATTGVFSRIGGYSTEFGDGYRNRLDVYMDKTDPTVTADTYAWALSSAANGKDGNHRRDFIFHAASNASGNILIAGDNGSTGSKRNDLATLNHYEITASGWYTYEWLFKDEGDGSLAVDMNLLDNSGNVLFTETRNTAVDVIDTEIGGNRYMWFTFITAEKLRIDNLKKAKALPTTADYASGSAFPVGTTTVTVSATNACSVATTCTFDVTVNDVEAPVFADCPTDVVICSDEAEHSWTHVKLVDNCVVQGGLSELTYQLSGATTSAAIAAGAFDGSTSGTETFNTGITTVTYSAKDSSGNVVSNLCSFTVEVKEAAEVEASTYAAICTNSSVTLAGSFSGASTSITWTDGAVGGTFAPNANDPVAVYTPPTGYSGSILLTITSDDPTGPCPVGVDTTTLVVKALPVIVLPSVPAICAGQNLNLTVSEGVSYAWSGPNGFTSALRNPQIPLATVSASGVYSVTITNASSCTASATVTVTVHPNVAPTITADNNEICKGESAVLTGSCSSNTDIFRWTTPGFNQGGVSSLSSTGTITVEKAGTYGGYCESVNGCISETTNLVINEKSNCDGGAFITVTPELPAICPGGSINLTATGCSGTLTWYASGASPVTGNPVSLSPTVTTSYFVSCSTGGSTSVDVKVAQTNMAESGVMTTGKARIKATEKITSVKKIGDATFTPAPNVIYEAGRSIELNPGFSTEHSTVFRAEIKVCN